jgi:hypothetical protein
MHPAGRKRRSDEGKPAGTKSNLECGLALLDARMGEAKRDKRHCGGIATCAATAACRTPESARD